AGFEPRENTQNDLTGVGSAVGGSIKSRGNENVVVPETRHFKLRRENADDDRRTPVERNRSPGKIAVAGEARAPQAVSDERNARSIGAVFVAGEIAPEE